MDSNLSESNNKDSNNSNNQDNPSTKVKEESESKSDQPPFNPLLSSTYPRVNCACSNCKRAKAKCDEIRPCSRCIRTGRELSCSDSIHQKRGRKLAIRMGNRSNVNNP